MKVRLSPRFFPAIVFLLLASALACGQTGGDASGTPLAPPTVSPVATATPLTAGDRMIIEEFAKQRRAIDEERDGFYQEFDDWRAELTACHPSSVQEFLQDFAAAFKSVTDQARNLPRTSITRELADLLIGAAEEEEAAFRQLRDRWQPSNVSFFEMVEQQRSGTARAQKSAEDMARELQEEFEDGPTPEGVEAAKEFSKALDSLEDAWDEFHSDYSALLQEGDGLDSAALIARHGQLIDQLNGMLETIAELPSTGATEGMIATLQDAAEAVVEALGNLTQSLSASAGASADASEEVAPAVSPDSEPAATESPPAEEPRSPVPSGPEIDDSLLDEVSAAFGGVEAALLETGLAIEEIVGDRPEENLADVEDFNLHYRELLVDWNAFHQLYDDWRKTGGGCDRVEVLQALGRFNQSVGDLGGKVRGLPQSGFLLPIYALLAEAAEREEVALRALYNSWRPFTADAFKAVDQERMNARRLRRQANIALQDLRDRP